MLAIGNISRAIFLGFFTGFLASIPLGPSGLESVNRSISLGFKEGFKVSLGAVFADISYIILINLGLFALLDKSKFFQSLFWIFSGIILIIFNKNAYKENNKSNTLYNKYNNNGFFTGFLITFINPTTPSLWIALSATVLHVWRSHGNIFFVFATSSMIIGSISWFCLLNIIVSKSFKKLKSDHCNKASNILNYFLFILGIIFIMLGFYKFMF